MPGFAYPVFPDNYTPVGDIATIAVCYVVLILMAFSYIRKSSSYLLFRLIVPTLIFAAAINVFYNVAIIRLGYGLPVFILHWLRHASLLLVFQLFVLYIAEVSNLSGSRKRILRLGSAALIVLFLAADAFFTFFGSAGRPGPEIILRSNRIFMAGYILYSVLCVVLMALVQKRLYMRVMLGFYGSVLLSFLVMTVQYANGQVSFTCLTFLFPVIAMFYIMHANPYDVMMGTIDGSALGDVIRDYYTRKKPFVYFSLFLPNYDSGDSEFPHAIRSLVRQSSFKYFRGSILFHVGNGHMIMLFPAQRNPGYEERISQVLSAFRDQRRIYRYEYKIVVGESVDALSLKNAYLPLIHSIHRTMEENTVHRVTKADLETYDRSSYILKQLEDIHKSQDLDDPRVLVYCQPVYNLQTGQYDTAEALMRLKLDEIGLVFPDQFIYLAEEHGYIHMLTKIILHKTCKAIYRLRLTGHEIARISVNVSVLELKDEHFCEDIIGIIARSGVSGDKVAIELTESQNESDFHVMKSKIDELKEKGIKFYLDDFGTGYSNMERIMELPFDIIKFDRSMVLSSGASHRSEKIVADLASLFSRLDYSVLYEGVETDADERMCRDMSASYLQGYKFSRPVPIADLQDWVPKKEKGAQP